MSETIWQFDTAHFTIVATVEPCDDDPADSFEDQESIDEIRAGNIEWFNVRVAVTLDGQTIGEDSLHGCAYATIAEFLEGHRDADPMNRNSSLMRKANGKNVVICHYFPNMIRVAIAEARRTIERLQSVKLRAA